MHVTQIYHRAGRDDRVGRASALSLFDATCFVPVQTIGKSNVSVANYLCWSVILS